MSERERPIEFHPQAQEPDKFETPAAKNRRIRDEVEALAAEAKQSQEKKDWKKVDLEDDKAA